MRRSPRPRGIRRRRSPRPRRRPPGARRAAAARADAVERLGGARGAGRPRAAPAGASGGDRARGRRAGDTGHRGRQWPPRRRASGSRRRVPSVFDTRALPSLYPGQVRRYRVSFQRPAHPARVQLAAALRERPPQRDRVPERAPHRAQRRSLHAVHARGARPAAGAAERARGDRRRAQGPGAARGAGGTGTGSSGRWSWCRPGRRTSRIWARCRACAAAGLRAAAGPSCCSTACSSAAACSRHRAIARREAALTERASDHAAASASRASARSSAASSSRCACRRPQLWSPDAPQPLRRGHHPARARPGGAARAAPDRAALGGGEARAPVAEQPPDPAARSVDP